ncbi:MAG TPA: phosphotransferase, partial [Acidimicrobiia bacterium]|nr:phosphotransferase [Acidimicrobiia bacterium]
MTEPGPILASGRDGDVFEFGPGLVLRKTRDGRSIEHEARIIRYVAAHGYPVPKIHDVRANGSEIVMDRIDGPLMMDTMLKPWKMPAMLRVLADLHDQLHEIAAPDHLRQMPDGGDRVVHLDLHPLNVIMAATGPVVIDWGNAARGEGMSDAALTYALLTCPRVPGPKIVGTVLQPLRPLVGKQFARRWWSP